MNRQFTQDTLRRDNLAFTGTGGISQNCRGILQAAFRDSRTGRVEIARFGTGQPAPMHLLDGVPSEWVAQRDGQGHIVALLDSIVAGFVRGRRFYTREEAAALV